MLELKEEVKGVATTYPLLTNDDLLKSQTVFLKKDLYV